MRRSTASNTVVRVRSMALFSTADCSAEKVVCALAGVNNWLALSNHFSPVVIPVCKLPRDCSTTLVYKEAISKPSSSQPPTKANFTVAVLQDVPHLKLGILHNKPATGRSALTDLPASTYSDLPLGEVAHTEMLAISPAHCRDAAKIIS